MATTKKSTTKAKTKTAAKSTTKKTTTKKVTRTKKPAAISASSKTTTNKLLTTRMLRRFNIVSALLYLLAIAPVVLLMKQTMLTVTLPYMTVDPLNQTGTLASAVRQLYVIDLRWLLVAILVLSALFSLLHATRLKDFYNRQIQKKQLWTRWLELALVGGVMFEVAALLSGWQTIFELKFVWLALLFLTYVGYRQEVHASENGVVRSEYQTIALIIKISLVIAFAATAFTTYIWGITSNPWYVYALYGVILVIFIMLGRHFKRAVDAPALVAERNYLVLSLVSRLAFVGLIVAGLYK